jgi:hypothetical protein
VALGLPDKSGVSVAVVSGFARPIPAALLAPSTRFQATGILYSPFWTRPERGFGWLAWLSLRCSLDDFNLEAHER